MKITLDTTTLMSAALHRKPGTIYSLFHRIITDDDLELILSDFILDEVERGLKKPYFASRVPAEEAAEFLTEVRNTATIITPSGNVRGVVRDPNDDPVIDTAVSGQAEYLISGDKDLLAVKRYNNVIILSPREFLTLIQEDEQQ